MRRPAWLIPALLALALLTLLVDQPSIRFERTASPLVDLPAGASRFGTPPLNERIALEPQSDGVLLRIEGNRRGRLRWEYPARPGVDRLRVVGSVSAPGPLPETRPGQHARLILMQAGIEKPRLRLLARWSDPAIEARIDRTVAIPDPHRPFSIELVLTPRSGEVHLHQLRVQGLATRAGIEALRGLVLVVWIGSILLTLRGLTRPMPDRLRGAVWSTLVLLLIGILAPPDLLTGITDLIHLLLPSGDTDRPGLDPHRLGHFLGFAVLALLMRVGRPDLGWPRSVTLFAALAIATELMQHLIDGRQGDWQDVILDLAGVAATLLVIGLVRSAVRAGTSIARWPVAPPVRWSRERSGVPPEVDAPARVDPGRTDPPHRGLGRVRPGRPESTEGDQRGQDPSSIRARKSRSRAG